MTSGVVGRPCVLVFLFLGVLGVLGMECDFPFVSESSIPGEKVLPVYHNKESPVLEETIDVKNNPDGSKDSSFASDTQHIYIPQDLNAVQPTETTGPNTHLTIQKYLKSSKIQKILEQCAEISKEFIHSKEDYSYFQKLFPRNYRQFSLHIKELKDLSNYLYKRRIWEILIGRPLLLEGGGVRLSNQIVANIDIILIKDCLSLFEEFVETGVYQVYKDSKIVNLMISDWTNLIVHFILDLVNLEIVPQGTILEFLRKDHGKLLWSLITIKYFPFDVASEYLNFDLRLSFAEDRNINNTKLRDIFQAFNEDAWKQAEFKLLKAKLLDKTVGVHSEFFHLITEYFLRIASPDKETSASHVEHLLEELMDYIPRVKFLKNLPSKILIHFKLMYDMIKFILREYPEVISKEFKESITFHKLCAFQESVGLISSLNHFMYEQSYLFFLNLKEEPKVITLWNKFNEWGLNDQTEKQVKITEQLKEKLKGSSYLTDSNNNRIYSHFLYDTQDVATDTKTLQELKQSSPMD
ncbi:hypothetical protein PGT21_010733 [Puccinia graminis f. sp. tritici]|nr:hypothetical protein PGT21_010733 [Puccinia graminis f. sp. tritici]